jgi:hypothetical protein
VSVPRRRFAARVGRLPLVCSLGLVLAACIVLLLPALALAFVSTGSDGSLCQSPQPPGDSFAVFALLDASQGYAPVGCPVLLTAGCRSEAVAGGGLTPQSFAWIVSSVGRPPPLGA